MLGLMNPLFELFKGTPHWRYVPLVIQRSILSQLLLQLKSYLAFQTWLPSSSHIFIEETLPCFVSFSRCFMVINIAINYNLFITSLLGENLEPGGPWTHVSHNLGEHLNSLDHQSILSQLLLQLKRKHFYVCKFL